MQDKEIVAKALEMVGKAYAPYSHFQVGAAVLAASGRLYGGANVENASSGATICAERSAIIAAVNAGERKLTAIAVCGGKDGKVTDYCPPCGICRQVMQEFAPELEVICLNGAGEAKTFTLKELLPYGFDGRWLPDEH